MPMTTRSRGFACRTRRKVSRASGPNSGTRTTSTGSAPKVALNPATAWRNRGESGEPKTMMGLFCKGLRPQLPMTSASAINHSRAVDSFRFSVFGFRMQVLVLIENIMV